MTPDQREQLKLRCGAMLQARGLALPSLKACVSVEAFWIGAVAALSEENEDAFTTICLLTGRLTELVTTPKEF